MVEIEEYGYPQIDFLGNRTVRITQGWFFPGVYENEPAMYVDYYVNEKGEVLVVLDNGNICFDFITHLDDYRLPYCKTMTIGDLYKKVEQKRNVKK